jgi:hypothetical protein
MCQFLFCKEEELECSGATGGGDLVAGDGDERLARMSIVDWIGGGWTGQSMMEVTCTYLGPMRGCGPLEHRGEDSNTNLNGISPEFYIH